MKRPLVTLLLGLAALAIGGAVVVWVWNVVSEVLSISPRKTAEDVTGGVLDTVGDVLGEAANEAGQVVGEVITEALDTVQDGAAALGEEVGALLGRVSE